MKRYIKASSGMSRNALIDALEEFNTAEDYERLEAVLTKVSGRDLEYLDDSDPDEGMYASFPTDMLERAYKMLTGDDAGATNFTLDLTEAEFNVVYEAMENFSDPAFTKDREMSRIAKQVLRKLNR